MKTSIIPFPIYSVDKTKKSYKHSIQQRRKKNLITLEAEVSAYSLTCLRRLWPGPISPIEDYLAPKRSRVRMFSFNVSGSRYIVLNGFL